VLCPAAGKVFPGVPKAFLPTGDQVEAVNACPHRECRTGCQLSVCAIGKKGYPEVTGNVETAVHISDCIECLGV
jgi:hypothetical protein